MIRVSANEARIELSQKLYPKESLQAAALAVSDRARVYLEQERGVWIVTLKAAGRACAAALKSAAGDFANEALSHAYRQQVVRFHAELTGPVLSRLFERGFPAPRPDPLEELEPQVAADRRAETEALLAAARKL